MTNGELPTWEKVVSYCREPEVASAISELLINLGIEFSENVTLVALELINNNIDNSFEAGA